jgi:hypothetical protein
MRASFALLIIVTLLVAAKQTHLLPHREGI